MGLSRLLVLLGILVLAPCPKAIADAEPARTSDDRVFYSLVAGLATTLAPMAVGAGLLASSPVREVKHAGIDLIDTGLTLGPLVSHFVAGESSRGVLFMLPTMASAVGMRLLLGFVPNVVEESTTEARVALVILISTTLVASTIGFVDSILASKRLRQKQRRNSIAGMIGPTQVGISFGRVL